MAENKDTTANVVSSQLTISSYQDLLTILKPSLPKVNQPEGLFRLYLDCISTLVRRYEGTLRTALAEGKLPERQDILEHGANEFSELQTSLEKLAQEGNQHSYAVMAAFYEEALGELYEAMAYDYSGGQAISRLASDGESFCKQFDADWKRWQDSFVN